MLFENYKESIRPFINYNKLKNVKKELNILYSPLVCLDKNGLLKFTTSHTIFVSYKEGSRIEDNINEEIKFFHNQYIPNIIFELIKHLLEKKFIIDISFLITEIANVCPLLESKEYGRSFNYDINELPEISSFYENDFFQNKLIIRKKVKNKKTSISLETLKDNFNSQDDCVITNLIHFEVENINDKNFITHLDHEFIIYELEEYAKKLNQYSKKGSKKIKTFKIDNSKIPLDYKYKNTPTLIYFAIEMLDNRELINEYFSNIQNNNI